MKDKSFLLYGNQSQIQALLVGTQIAYVLAVQFSRLRLLFGPSDRLNIFAGETLLMLCLELITYDAFDDNHNEVTVVVANFIFRR